VGVAGAPEVLAHLVVQIALVGADDHVQEGGTAVDDGREQHADDTGLDA